MTELSGFLGTEYPEKSKELAEAFDILSMGLGDEFISLVVSAYQFYVYLKTDAENSVLGDWRNNGRSM